mgnify:CR=1 FL=1
MFPLVIISDRLAAMPGISRLDAGYMEGWLSRLLALSLGLVRSLWECDLWISCGDGLC